LTGALRRTIIRGCRPVEKPAREDVMQRPRRVRDSIERSVPVAPPGSLTRPRRTAHGRPRRTQESRSREARERLLAATIEVLIDRGYNGLTTKEVASRAGFSNGALVHHYGTKADLVVAATAHVYDRCIESGKGIAAQAGAKKNILRAFIEDCTNVYFEWPFLAACEVLILARTDPLLMAQIEPVMQHYRKTMNTTWLEAFARGGIAEGEASFLIMSTLNLIRGMAVNSFWQRDVASYNRLLREWVELAESGAFRGRRGEVR
jgi:AcrR family transcriptional regulator